MSLEELFQEAVRKKEEVCMGVEHGVRVWPRRGRVFEWGALGGFTLSLGWW